MKILCRPKIPSALAGGAIRSPQAEAEATPAAVPNPLPASVDKAALGWVEYEDERYGDVSDRRVSRWNSSRMSFLVCTAAEGVSA